VFDAEMENYTQHHAHYGSKSTGRNHEVEVTLWYDIIIIT